MATPSQQDILNEYNEEISTAFAQGFHFVWLDNLHLDKIFNKIPVPQINRDMAYISMRYNNLTSIPDDIFPNTTTSLRLDHNKLTTVPHLPPHLENLSIAFNNIKTWDITQESIKELSISGNKELSIKALPPALLDLGCGECNLTSLPELPSTLKKLIVYYNKLTELPPLPDSLKYLNCHNNNLIYLPSLPASLIELDCRDNRLPAAYNRMPYEEMKHYIARIRLRIEADNRQRQAEKNAVMSVTAVPLAKANYVVEPSGYVHSVRHYRGTNWIPQDLPAQIASYLGGRRSRRSQRKRRSHRRRRT